MLYMIPYCSNVKIVQSSFFKNLKFLRLRKKDLNVIALKIILRIEVPMAPSGPQPASEGDFFHH